MQIWNDISQRTSPIIWASATVISLILLSLVISQVDWDLTIEILLKSSPVFLLFSMIFFLAEGVFTTLRFYLLTPNKPMISSCFKVTAWYVVFLVLLPARLGEVIVILLLKQHLNQNTSPALMNVLVQRLFDVIILSSIFLITALTLTPFSDSSYLNIIAIVIITLVSMILFWLDNFLMISAKLIIRKHTRPKNKWLRHALRMILQARIWHRHRLTTSKSIQTILLTVFKWVCNLGGFALLMKALQLPLAISNSVVLGAAYNFLAIIPLQTIGGFGISEAGLTSLLLLSGMSLTLAASATIIVRLIIITVPLLFWCIVMSSIKLMTKQEIND
jgi:hypothetical protein